MIIIFGNSARCEVKKAKVEITKNPFGSIYNDPKKALNTANANLFLWEKTFENSQKQAYLEQAMRFYYITTKIDSSIIDANIGMGRVYDAMNLDRQAKEYFYKALNINPSDAKANLYFANFFYRREDYLNALKYYKTAYKNGFSKNAELNEKMGIIYEKLADLETAKAFYTQAYKLNPKNSELSEKIRLLDELNYSDSQYYLFKNVNK